jgi:hypothetical protein
LTEGLRALRAATQELAVAIEDEELTGPSPEELDALSARVRGAIDHGPITLRKAVLQELMAGVTGETGGSCGRPSGCRFAGFVSWPEWCTQGHRIRTPPLQSGSARSICRSQEEPPESGRSICRSQEEPPESGGMPIAIE